ncbi:MAG TPA: DUF2079 domain-containing protein [Actinospica sp.]|nr:DUF2079 domain-containing protein [Actinospica sp.]
MYCADSLARYYRAAPGSYDLGIFVQVVRDYAHFHAPIVDILQPGFDLLGDHFHPILAVLGPVFWLFPSPVTLLLAQAALFAVAAVPLVWLGRERIGTGGAYAVGVAYGLSFGVAQAVDFDFHEIAFAVPLLSFAIWGLLTDHYKTIVLCCFLCLLVKEDLGLTFVLPIGIASILRGQVRFGAAVAAMGTAGSLIAIYWLIPHFNPQHVYTYWSKNNCVGSSTATAGVATASHGDPISCLWDSATNTAGTKIELVFLLLAVTAFVAPRSPLCLLIVPNLGLRFISTDTSFWGTTYHYNAVLMPVLCLAAIDAIDRAKRATPFDEEAVPGRRVLWARYVSEAMGRHGAVAMLAVSFAMIPQFAFSQFFNPSTFTFDPRTAELRHAVAFVPDNVTAEGTMNVLAPLAAKDDAFWIGNGNNPPVQYVVLDTVVSGFSGTISDPVQFVESRHPGTDYHVVWSDAYGIYVLERTG